MSGGLFSQSSPIVAAVTGRGDGAFTSSQQRGPQGNVLPVSARTSFPRGDGRFTPAYRAGATLAGGATYANDKLGTR